MPTSPAHSNSHLRPASALLLCLMIANPILPAQPAANAPSSEKPAVTIPKPNLLKLTPDQRIDHLLNRFTFGPTPEEIAQVKKIGINAWFDQQLHPDRIPDRELDTRLAEFPALTLPVDTLLQRFPDGAAIRQTANGKLAVPSDRYLAAIYNRHIDLYQQKQAEKAEQKDQTQPAPAMGMTGNASVSIPQTATTPAKTAKPYEPATGNPSTPRPAYASTLTQTVLALPPAQRVDRVLAMQPAEYQQFRTSLNGPQKLQLTQDMTPQQRELLEDFDNPTHAVVEEMQAQRLLRDIYSSRQLQEVMTSFWLNHFNVYLHKNEQEPYYLVSYERDVIRPRALSNFEDLLVATAQSPAMLIYLDNSASTGPDSAASEKQKQRAAQGKPTKATPPGLNENYARELMELHTLGVNGGYTQKDVTEVAKVFTGWTVDKPNQGGGFKFDETRHQPGDKTVLGKKIKENAQKEGLELLHRLATSPATARFISQELAIAFVSDTPPPALVNRMTKTFLSSHGSIPAVLTTMVHAPEFWFPAIYQAKVKTPLECVVSAARVSGTEITNTQPLVNALNQMGMPLYACVPPTGYSAKASEWVSTGALVTRMNFALSLATNHYPGIKTNWPLDNSHPITPDLSEQLLEARLIPTGISTQTRTAVLTQSQAQSQPLAPNLPGTPTSLPVNTQQPNPAVQAAALDRQNAQLAGLLLGSPEFQRR
jgi:uncharacterized protein (DUF1800 family)